MDPVVWPKPVLKLAAAITVAEGSKPEWNNPGDLTYSFGLPIVGVVNSEGVLHFVNKEDGEWVLLHECYLMLTGKSRVYQLDWTLEKTGLKYAHGNKDWAVNVARELGVPTSTTLGQIAEMQWAEAA